MLKRSALALTGMLTAGTLFVLAVNGAPQAFATFNNGIVQVESAYPMAETLNRLQKDIASKDIKLFSVVDQSGLAVEAGIVLRPSTLLVFGNPALGAQLITPNPEAGPDWPVRLLVFQDEKEVSGLPTRTSALSRSGTASATATRPSPRPPRSSLRSPPVS